MEGLVARGGNPVAVAVQKIKRVYGTSCVLTLIRRRMQCDEQNGGHAQLL